MGSLRLSLAIQHHPRRAEMLQAIVSALTPLTPEVIRDPEADAPVGSSWRTYRLALERTPEWATHRIVLQDDARPCRSFARVIPQLVASRPDRLLVLCLCGRPVVEARKAAKAHARGERWIELRRGQWVPTIALVWPARLVRPALDFVSAQNLRWDPRFQADDEIVGRAMAGLGEFPLASVPSVVQHDDVVPSLLGQRARAGRDAGRVAALFADDLGDPLSLVWA